MDFAKSVKAITLPQNVASTSDCRLIELENQVQRLMEAYLAPTQPTQVNKITSPCEICSGPMTSGIACSINAITIHPKQPDESQVDEPKVKQEEDNPRETNSSPHPQPDPLASIATEQIHKLNSMLELLRLVPQSSNTIFVCSKEDDGESDVDSSII
ncbi:hypothetical protein Tco_0823036 [Tanacetum coccineum]|uniref:Uncharacterized protein n=1 Tax=Tanacetum coccineum TaxID=301880 RepID=A0ABQ5AJS1_9ASTR